MQLAFSSAHESIQEAFEQIRILTQHRRQHNDIREFQKIFSPTGSSSTEEASLPCTLLPPAKDSRFFDRDEVVDRIEEYLNSRPEKKAFRSIALHGVGGVGKSHVALKYAHRRAQQNQLDAILWMHSANDLALTQSFTDAAIALKLPGAAPNKVVENRINVLTWLQRTGKTYPIALVLTKD